MIKKFACLAIIFSFCFSAVACEENNSEPKSENPPSENEEIIEGDDKEDQINKNVFLIGSWVSYYNFSVKSFEYQTEQLSKSGLNFLCFPYMFAVAGEHYPTTLVEWQNIDSVMKENKMFYDISLNPHYMQNYDNMGMALDYSEYMSDYMIGYHLWDEPMYGDLPVAASWYAKYLKEDIQHRSFVNLNGSSGVADIDFYTYSQKWVDLVGAENLRCLSYDLYPFADNGVVYDSNKYLNMEAFRKISDKYYDIGGIDLHAFLQSTGFVSRKMPNINEISWDAWSFLAYGFDALSYFNYVCPGAAPTTDESLIYCDGTIHDQLLYDNVTALNYKLRAVGDILINYDCVHAYHTDKTKGYSTEYLPSDYFITQKTTGCDTVISYFKPYKGYEEKYIFLFNNDWNNEKIVDYELDLYSGISGLEYFDPVAGNYIKTDIKSGKLSVAFGAGEGRLYRIIGNVDGE